MKKIFLSIILFSFLLGCKKQEDSFLSKRPTNIILNDHVWSDPKLITSVLADLYDRIPDYQQLEQYANLADFDEAFPSRSAEYGRVQNQTYSYSSWAYWDYAYVREINLFIEKCRKATNIAQTDRDRFLAEAQFLRANVYFELVKRMGGVPLILEAKEYDFSGDPSYLHQSRAKESEIYNFIIKQLDSAQINLPRDPGMKARATWGAALAMKSRAALYAGSIAEYGVKTPAVSLPGEIVGIPSSQANQFYQTALEAAQQLINSNFYSLYLKHPDDLQKNFAQLFLDKNNNPEIIFVKDYKLRSRTTQFTVQNQPHSLTEEGSWSGFLNPSLNLAQSFEKLDNTFVPFEATDASGNYIKYDNVGDIFKDRDARLGGSIILPGSQFKGEDLDIWAGYMLPNNTIITGSAFGQKKVLPGEANPSQVVGFDGPIDQLENGAQTGFYIRKYSDPATGAGQIGVGSEVSWVRYRFAEVLLNAAEAAFALGQKSLASTYMNLVRARAGLLKPLSDDEVTFDRIVHERNVEFAFEGQKLWDYKRWRLAHQVWNGVSSNLTKLPGDAYAPSTRMFALWPYKLYAPGTPDNGKWIFRVTIPSVINNAHQFRMGNYYSQISPAVLSNNPKLLQNPNQ